MPPGAPVMSTTSGSRIAIALRLREQLIHALEMLLPREWAPGAEPRQLCGTQRAARLRIVLDERFPTLTVERIHILGNGAHRLAEDRQVARDHGDAARER